MFNKVVLITGMPRSGTSWLGQIVDSSPDVAYRLEPLFSYRYKNIINKESDALSINRFLKSIYLTTDEFICQTESRSIGRYPSYHKNESPSVLAIKTTRHHELLSKYLRCIDDLEVVSIVRHPCAVINSWISTDKEFKDKGCSVAIDWKSGVCRKDGIGESWGLMTG
ncbi:sulfotransferase [Candidatus Reidiella endopervernicosa]|uniref:Sulfotransferase n=1 Tax=Candidatus Reidiella endopervernicosa TaxID=2738883 RepID=A0A6N0HV40_9GAMM|nr:sulfotransferase [Candidatus Reidiella endopervernicosa]QKQ26219.1 sulfotransferase [Candidatus Reidiella endopervernicosa]